MTMKKICLLSTGGTIAAEAGADGLVPRLDGRTLIGLLPELRQVCTMDCRELLQLDSSNLQPEHWQLMAQAVEKHYSDYDGFVITHGTDTMAYSAAALSYMLKNLAKPVVFTGSQLPITAPGTDAKRNLSAAFQVAAADHGGVYLVFGGKIIRGTQAKKLYTENFAAFASVNRPAAGTFTGDEIIWQEMLPDKPLGPFHCVTDLNPRVAVLKLIPGTEPKLMDLFIAAGYKGIIIEGFGAGGVPNDGCARSFLPSLRQAVAAGVTVVCTSQCVYDGVHLGRYEVGIMAQRCGAISGGDMTIEAITAKLMLALGQTPDREEIKRLLHDNILGEVE